MAEHPLTPFLSERFPQLGLDFETYGPYVTGALDVNEDDDDALEGIMDLLRSSSESHCDDDAVWTELRVEIERRSAEFRQQEEKRREDELNRVKQVENEKVRKALMEAEQYEQEHHAQERDTALDDEKKKRIDDLVSRYGYEEEGGDTPGVESTSAAPSDAPSNRDVAAAAAKAHGKKVREDAAKSNAGKKVAREATAKQKLERNQMKEERRKRATKGERHRN